MVILLSLGAAMGYAISSVLQQRAAAREPMGHAMKASLVLRLLRRPLWLAGKAVDVVATVLQAIAIHLGSLIVVEPLLASGLLFALPLGAAIAGTRLRRQDWQGALALTAGLAVFTAAARNSGGRQGAPLVTWCLLGGLLATATWVLIALAQNRFPSHRAPLLAAAGALLYAGTAALTKPVTKAWTTGLNRLASSWELYAMLAASLVAAVVVQSAFQDRLDRHLAAHPQCCRAGRRCRHRRRRLPGASDRQSRRAPAADHRTDGHHRRDHLPGPIPAGRGDRTFAAARSRRLGRDRDRLPEAT